MFTLPRRTHVLIVDDYDDLAELLSEMLIESSASPITTDVGYNSAQAIELAKARPPQFVLLDVDMPVMSGLDAALAIRALYPADSTVLIGMTGNPARYVSADVRRAFDHVLTKPVDITRILSLIASAPG